MILSIGKQLAYRLNIIALASLILLLIEAQYFNEIILLLFDPIKELHNDWYNKLIHNIINYAFDIFDTELQTDYITEYTVEYVPSCEITIHSTILNQTITILAINISILTIAAIIWYNLILHTIPSMFTFEKKIYIYKQILIICLFIITIMLTHTVWTHIFFNLSLHNYSEFNYYEFDVDFDMHSYISKYIYTIYITYCLLLVITNKKCTTYTTLMLILIALRALQIINILEIGYYILITVTYSEIKKLIYIFSKKRNNLYTLV